MMRPRSIRIVEAESGAIGGQPKIQHEKSIEEKRAVYESKFVGFAGKRIAGDMSQRIDSISSTRITAKRAQVVYFSVINESFGTANYLSAGIDAIGRVSEMCKIDRRVINRFINRR